MYETEGIAPKEKKNYRIFNANITENENNTYKVEIIDEEKP